MNLDASTLIFAGGLVAFASGLFLLMHWWQAREDWPGLSWAAGSCGVGIGVMLIALHARMPAGPAQIAGPLVIAVCASEFWAAARIFTRGAAQRRPVIAAVALGLTVILLASVSGHILLARILILGLPALFHGMAAVELWRVKRDHLRGRSAMIFLLGMQAIAYLMIGASLKSNLSWQGAPVDWPGVINFLGLIFSVGSAIAMVTMLKDRSEIKHKRAALADPLTGLPNRRAVTTFGLNLLDASKTEGAPISVLAVDLDKFKLINDTFGHAAGDEVLRVLADVLRGATRKNDMAARLGGDEFALVLPDCGFDEALAVAGRVRANFQDNAQFLGGKAINATVSVGVATAPGHGSSLAGLFASADEALYRAKSLGRNQLASSLNDLAAPSKISRIA